jgi:hypothetical protein
MMILPLASMTPVLAAGNRLTKWLSGELLFHLAVIVGAVVLVWLGITFVERFRIRLRPGGQSPQGLFRELCRAHALTRAERQLLSLISDAVPPRQCCRVFIDGRIIDDYSRAHPALAEQCRRLSQTLFGESGR